MALLRGVPKLEKRVFLAALALAAVELALIVYAAERLGITVPTCVTDVKPFGSGELVETAPGRYEAHIVASMWQFDPPTLKVPKGSVIDFYLTSADVVHGFYIHGTNVNLTAVPFTVNYARARFDRPGTYPILCHEYCGAGHQLMAASLEVAP